MTLEFVDEFEMEDESYSFALTRVMFDSETSKYHIGEDHGCSCPCPFEDFQTLADWGRPLAPRTVITKIRVVNVVASCIDGKRHAVDAVTEHAKAHGLW